MFTIQDRIWVPKCSFSTLQTLCKVWTFHGLCDRYLTGLKQSIVAHDNTKMNDQKMRKNKALSDFKSPQRYPKKVMIGNATFEAAELIESKHLNLNGPKSSKEKINAEGNFQLAISIGMVHAGLVLIILICYGVGLLLQDYLKPIFWAFLISMPLRELQGVVVNFWERPLQSGFVETALAIPVALFYTLIETTHDLHEVYSKLSGGGSLATPPKAVTFSKLFQWLLSFGICTLVYESLGPLPLLILIGVGYTSSWSIIRLFPKFKEVFFPMTTSTIGKRRSSATKFILWTLHPVVRATRYLKILIEIINDHDRDIDDDT